MIHHNEKGKESGYQNLGVSSKIYDNSTQFNYGYYDFTVGGDFLPNKKTIYLIVPTSIVTQRLWTTKE